VARRRHRLHPVAVVVRPGPDLDLAPAHRSATCATGRDPPLTRPLCGVRGPAGARNCKVTAVAQRFVCWNLRSTVSTERSCTVHVLSTISAALVPQALRRPRLSRQPGSTRPVGQTSRACLAAGDARAAVGRFTWPLPRRLRCALGRGGRVLAPVWPIRG
jgi:hypothetical protein